MEFWPASGAVLSIYTALACALFSVFLRLIGRFRAHEAFLLAASISAILMLMAARGGTIAAAGLAGIAAIWTLNAVAATGIAKAVSETQRRQRMVLGQLGNLVWLAAVHGVGILEAKGAFSITVTLAILFGAPLVAANAIIYLHDVARKRISPDILFLGLHLFFLPKTLAGPVMSPRAFAATLRSVAAPHSISENFGHGVMAIVVGLFKAEVMTSALMNPVFPVVNAARAGGTITTVDAVVCILALGAGAYFAVSGASNVGRGLAMLFGVRLPDAFRRPLGALDPVIALGRCQVGLVGMVQRIAIIPLAGQRVFSIYAATLAAWIFAGAFFGFRAVNLVAGAFFGVIVVVTLVLRAMGGRAAQGLGLKPSWVALGKLVIAPLRWLVTMVLLSLASSILFVGTLDGYSHLLTGALGQNGTFIPAGLQSLFRYYNVTLGRLLPWHPQITDNPLITQHDVGLLGLLVLLAGISAAQAFPRLFNRYRAGPHIVCFAVALYFIVAWQFVGAPTIFP